MNFDLDTVVLTELLLRFGYNLITVLLIVRLVYYARHREKEFAFTYVLFNIIIFFVSYLMLAADISMGFAFGLFAIFGILRYRTDAIPIKEMTYLLAVIAVALINVLGRLDLLLLLINGAIILSIYIMERLWFAHKESYTTVIYEKIELLNTMKKDELIADLRERTGLNINRVVIKSYNFINDSAEVKVYFNNETDEA